MIDKDLIESYEPSTKVAIKSALATLARIGILNAQKDRLLARLAAGNEGADVNTLAHEILDYRANVSRLAGLQHLGESYIQKDN